MTVARVDDGTLRFAMDRANPNNVPDQLRRIGIGSLLQGQIEQVRRAVDFDAAGTDAGNLATTDALVLPDGGKAAVVHRAFARTGTGTLGELTVLARHVTPTLTTHIAVAPNGNIVTLAADVYTDVDVYYLPDRGDVLTTTFPVVSDDIVLPASVTDRVVIGLWDANVVEGTSTGRKIILTPGGGPAAGQASLDIAGTTVTFAGADAATRATVTLLLGAAEPLAELLEGVNNTPAS